MADNPVVSNSPTSINPDIPVRTIEKSGQQTQVVTLDLGGAGAEELTSGTIPVSGTISVDNLPVDPATATKQDTGNTTLAAINTEQEVQTGWLSSLYNIITQSAKAIIASINYPSFADRTLQRVRATGIIESGTVTTVTTVTGLTNIDSYPGGMVIKDLSRASWAVNVRGRFT